MVISSELVELKLRAWCRLTNAVAYPDDDTAMWLADRGVTRQKRPRELVCTRARWAVLPTTALTTGRPLRVTTRPRTSCADAPWGAQLGMVAPAIAVETRPAAARLSTAVDTAMPVASAARVRRCRFAGREITAVFASVVIVLTVAKAVADYRRTYLTNIEFFTRSSS